MEKEERLSEMTKCRGQATDDRACRRKCIVVNECEVDRRSNFSQMLKNKLFLEADDEHKLMYAALDKSIDLMVEDRLSSDREQAFRQSARKRVEAY